MEDKKLFELRGSLVEFSNPFELKVGIESYFFKDYNFSLVSGYDFGRGKFDEWSVRSLEPKSGSDKLTVLNFLGGLEELSCLNNSWENFKGNIIFQGVERANPIFCGDQLMFASFKEKNLSYALGIRLNVDNSEGLNRLVYSARSFREISRVEGVMANYLGPNLK